MPGMGLQGDSSVLSARGRKAPPGLDAEAPYIPRRRSKSAKISRRAGGPVDGGRPRGDAWPADMLVQQQIRGLRYAIHKDFMVSMDVQRARSRVVLITGASGGIGEAFAHLLGGDNCDLVLTARNDSELNRVRGLIVARHPERRVTVIAG
ncbi:MAG: SDR family NAD(P)-dependent oxidoreductase, partial [Pseudomonadota bacterium]|nr:SDR family NAD(P)-dependent oxidoreductase [Pseudomonadota bacterium]